MKVKKKDGVGIKEVLAGMIMDRTVCATVADRWTKEGLFDNPWADLVAGWAVAYYEKYNRPPGRAIQTIYETWSAKTKDKDSAELASEFLEGLSNTYVRQKKDINPQYVIDQAGILFNMVRYRQLAASLEADVADHDIAAAEKRLSSFQRVEVGDGGWVDPFRNPDAMRAAFAAKSEPIIRYKGALGEFYGDALERDGFIAYMGPEKRGKTWKLMDVGFRAALQGRKVAFFEVGDMSQNQIMRRFAIRVARRPLKPQAVLYPRGIHSAGDGATAEVERDTKEFTKPISAGNAIRACAKRLSTFGDPGARFRLFVAPNSSISINGIRNKLRSWEKQDGWVPDVVVIDYADILAPINGAAESRDQINATWKGMRALSQEMHCLVVTATQSDAKSYNTDILGKANFSEDKRKFAHVTGMVGLNCTEEEKREGILRLNWLVLREGEFTESKCVHVAGCLAIGDPCVVSTF